MFEEANLAKLRGLGHDPPMAKKKSPTALLIIDMINTLDFPEGKSLLKHALPVAENIRKIKAKMKKKNVPVIYLNDHYGHWRDDLKAVYEYCSQDKFPGKKLSAILKPEDDDYFLLKPKHSGFYGTQLDLLLSDLGVKKLIITGVAGNICILFTVNDAYMREFQIHVPENAIASNSARDNQYALNQFREVFGIETKPL